MTREDLVRCEEELMFKSRYDDLFELYKEYENECRQNGDLEELAYALEYLSFFRISEGREEELKAYLDDLVELRKALAQHDYKKYGEAYAILLTRKSYNTPSVFESIECHKEAINIYKKLGLYDDAGFDIGNEDAFGYLGQLYCYQDDYELGIHYTTIALKRAIAVRDNDFNVGLYYRRLSVAYLSMGEAENARKSIQKAQEYFKMAESYDYDPDTYADLFGSCRQLLTECDERGHSNEFYKQWLI